MNALGSPYYCFYGILLTTIITEYIEPYILYNNVNSNSCKHDYINSDCNRYFYKTCQLQPKEYYSNKIIEMLDLKGKGIDTLYVRRDDGIWDDIEFQCLFYVYNVLTRYGNRCITLHKK